MWLPIDVFLETIFFFGIIIAVMVFFISGLILKIYRKLINQFLSKHESP